MSPNPPPNSPLPIRQLNRQRAYPHPAEPRRPRWIGYGANTLLALGLLWSACPQPGLFGIGAASLFAGPKNQIPLQEVALRRTNRIITEIIGYPAGGSQQRRSKLALNPSPSHPAGGTSNSAPSGFKWSRSPNC